MKRALAVLVVVAGCGEAPTDDAPAKFWTVANAVKNRSATADFGGFSPLQLVALQGEPIPFRSPPYAATETKQGPGAGITIFPAYAEGQPAAYAIFDLWHAHPQPWVHPVWIFVTDFFPPNPGSRRRVELSNVFPVDVTASFYSAYWKATFVVAPDAAPDTFKNAKSILDARLPMHAGSLVLCPIVPAGAAPARASGEPAPVHPFTGDALLNPQTMKLREASVAWVDGQNVTYFDVGGDRAAYVGDALVEERAYFFARHVEGKLVPSSLPAVLPARAWQKSLARRVDVDLPEAARVFVPDGRPELAAAISAEGFTVPAADPAIPADVAQRHLLRVALNASCFADATQFPQGCTWLDSEAALVARLSPWRLVPSQTQLTLAALFAEGAPR